MQVTLPWPSRTLHPNARVHYMQLAKAKKKARADAALLAQAAGVKSVKSDAPLVSWTFCPPDRRRRDMDGALASCKAYADGLADAMGVDDSRWCWQMQWGPVVKGGEVRVEIEA